MGICRLKEAGSKGKVFEGVQSTAREGRRCHGNEGKIYCPLYNSKKQRQQQQNSSGKDERGYSERPCSDTFLATVVAVFG